MELLRKFKRISNIEASIFIIALVSIFGLYVTLNIYPEWDVLTIRYICIFLMAVCLFSGLFFSVSKRRVFDENYMKDLEEQYEIVNSPNYIEKNCKTGKEIFVATIIFLCFLTGLGFCVFFATLLWTRIIFILLSIACISTYILFLVAALRKNWS